MIEDDPADVLLTRKAMERSRIRIDLHVAEDAEAGLEFLRSPEKRNGAAVPDIILLDLNLPRMSGQEFLTELRADPALKAIPLVVLTTSEVEADIVKLYELGANCYVSKPVGLEEFYEIIEKLEDFWFSVVRLPKP